ncbi:MAG: biotin--[acetyl-CoA-carboxylase] ligase [Candidatus Cloacimonetes bacterium]|nr:biotin--[acetyl-CoA-carboxylase] ligase [Candidatus Cloacimonadota bacterium]
MKNFKHPLFDEVLHFNKVSSTSSKAERLINSNTTQGNFLCLAGEQSSGKGRGNNSWFAPAGGLWLTAALYRFDFKSNITIFTGICIHKTLSELFPAIAEKLKIKWPNDIYLSDKKICGILTSNLSNKRYHLIGIGMNTNVIGLDEEMSPNATSLQIELGKAVDNEKVLTSIFNNFASALPGFVEEELDEKYFNQHSLLKGLHIELDTDYDTFRGKAKGIDKNGALLIELKSGMIQPFYAGSVISWTQ